MTSNAKIIFVLLVLVAMLIFLIANRHDFPRLRVDNCLNLFEDGETHEDHRHKTWKPKGCSLKWYSIFSGTAVKHCFERRATQSAKNQTSILLLGDSRARQIQGSFHQYFSPDHHPYSCLTDPENPFPLVKTCNFSHDYSEYRLVLERWWSPVDHDWSEANSLIRKISRKTDNELPDLIYINTGIHLVRWCWKAEIKPLNCAAVYERNIKTLLKYLGPLSRRTVVVWAPMTLVHGEIIPRLSVNGLRTNEILQAFNTVAQRALNNSNIMWWSSYFQIFHFFNDTYDGKHLGQRSLSYVTQVLLNLLCNRFTSTNLQPSDYCCS